MRNQDGRMPVRAEYRGLPAVPADQVVTGLIPHEPPNFQTPAALDLLSGPVCVVTGPHGVGKTQLAAAYARQRVSEGWLVAWIGAETSAQITAGMVELADQLGLYRPEVAVEVALAGVRNYLHTRRGPALLVFDNAVSLDEINSFMPTVGTCQVVVTRTLRSPQIKGEVPVDVFTPEVALKFLQEATGLDSDAAAAELAQELGYLPLAVAQAAAQVKAARWDYSKYLENFRRFPANKYLRRRDGDPYPRSAATAILMALESFQDSELVELLSVLSPDGVSREVLGDTADDELVRLHESSLVEFAGSSSVLMHRLVQRVIRERSEQAGVDQDVVVRCARLLQLRTQFDGHAWERRQLGSELVRQAEALWKNVSPDASPDVVVTTSTVRLWAAGFLAETSSFILAGAIACRVYCEAVERLGQNHQLVTSALQTIHEVNELDEMSYLMELDLTLFQEGLAQARSSGEARSPGRPSRSDDVFSPEAIASLERGTAHQIATEGAGSRSVLFAKSVLADAHALAGGSKTALAIYREVHDTFRSTLGQDNPVTLLSGAKLGAALHEFGHHEHAHALLHWTHALASLVLGDDHDTTVVVRSVLERVRDA